MSAVMQDYVYPMLMPWAKMLQDLYSAGYTDYRIGKCLGVDHSTVEAWGKGSEPRHSFGEALVVLHRRVCGDDCGKLRHSESKPRE